MDFDPSFSGDVTLVLETDETDVCPPVWMHLMILNYTVKGGYHGEFMCSLPQFRQFWLGEPIHEETFEDWVYIFSWLSFW